MPQEERNHEDGLLITEADRVMLETDPDFKIHDPEHSETRTLFCRLTTEEQAERGTALERLLQEEDKLTAEKQALSLEIKRVMAEVMKVRHVVGSGAEQRPVLCELDYDLDRHNVVIIRLDTGEEIESRAIRSGEWDKLCQPKLPLEGEQDPESEEGASEFEE